MHGDVADETADAGKPLLVDTRKPKRGRIAARYAAKIAERPEKRPIS